MKQIPSDTKDLPAGQAGKYVGRRCFVVASGPSIASMDLRWLKDEIVICVNESYKALEFAPTYVCIGDRELWPRVKDAYTAMDSQIVCTTGLNGQVGSDYAGDNLLAVVPLDKSRAVPDGHFRHDLKSVYMAYNVIGETVLPFVLHAGFAECYLIGCDCTDDGYFYDQSESARQDDFPQKVFPQAIQAYGVIADYADRRGLTRIFNAGYGGALEVFPRVHFDSLRPGAAAPPLVIGYHTPHEQYRELAEGMRRSVQRFGLECIVEQWAAWDVEGPTRMANWVANCAICPAFIRSMQMRHRDRDLIFLDADAVMEKRPALYLDEPRDYDFAAPFLTNQWTTNELQSNSLFFRASPRARRLVDLWAAEQRRRIERMVDGQYEPPYREAWDQKVLHDVLPSVAGLTVRELPQTYGKIMPTDSGVEITPDTPLADAVITQHQASRRLKDKV